MTPARAPNDLWATDFKGWFRTRDGERCDPLTITDLYARYLLRCQAVDAQDIRSSGPVFEALFKEFGMPGVMRSDNGSPFASKGIGGLTRLSVQWVKAGIKVEHIEAGHPEPNGCHERMHRTLKEHTSAPPAATIAQQQERFDRFRDYFNNQRPHQALGQTPPAQHYRPSLRQWPARLEDPWYDADHQVRRVRTTGEIKWRGEKIFIGESLVGELLGIRQLHWGDWLLSFVSTPLALIDYRSLKLKALGAGAYPPPPDPQPLIQMHLTDVTHVSGFLVTHVSGCSTLQATNAGAGLLGPSPPTACRGSLHRCLLLGSLCQLSFLGYIESSCNARRSEPIDQVRIRGNTGREESCTPPPGGSRRRGSLQLPVGVKA